MADYDSDLEPSRNLVRSLYNNEVPSGWLRAALSEAVGSSVCPLDRCHNPELLRDSLALLDESLILLSDKTGERAIAARATITTERESLQADLDLFESLGANLEGPRALEILRRIAEVRAARKSAELAVELAPPEGVAECIVDFERAKAAGRMLCREVVDLGRALKASSKRALPSRASFDAAREHSQELANLPARKPKATHLQLALAMGEKAGPEALFWPCFETTPHILFDLRAERLDAARGA